MDVKEIVNYSGLGSGQLDVGQAPHLAAAYDSLISHYEPLPALQNVNLNTVSPVSQDLLNSFANENREIAKICGAATGIIDSDFGSQAHKGFVFNNVYYNTPQDLLAQNESVVLTNVDVPAVAASTSNATLAPIVHLNESGEIEFNQFQTIDQSTDPSAHNFLFLDVSITDLAGLTIGKALATEISEIDPQ